MRAKLEAGRRNREAGCILWYTDRSDLAAYCAGLQRIEPSDSSS